MPREKAQFDFHDYLTLRRARDRGEAPEDAERLLGTLEDALPVRFADAVPRMVEPLQVPERAYPRGLGASEVRFMFAAREDLARVGTARRALGGRHDLATHAEGLKDWLDVVEHERRAFKQVQQALRDLDRRIWAAFTGERRMPVVNAGIVQRDFAKR